MKNVFPISLSLTPATVSLAALAHDPNLHQPKGVALFEQPTDRGGKLS